MHAKMQPDLRGSFAQPCGPGYNGKFPTDHVYQIIRGDVNMPAHGNKEMPVWGPVFLAMSAAHPAQVQMRLTNLAKYLESLQQE